MIYAVTAHNPRFIFRGDTVLKRLAEATGGRAFILKKFDAADSTFAQIEDELRTQYSITFRPRNASRCGYHNLQVPPVDQRPQIRSGNGYYSCD